MTGRSVKSITMAMALVSIVTIAGAAWALPAFAAWQNPTDRSTIWARSQEIVPAKTTIHLKILQATQYTCALRVESKNPKLAQADWLGSFDCMQGHFKPGDEVTVTTRNAGILSVSAGNYGEQITSLVPTGGGYEVTWTGDKSTIRVGLY